jgi:hypothetical protein
MSDKESWGSIDEGDFLPEHHMLRAIEDVLENEMYRGLSAVTVIGVLNSLAMNIAFNGFMNQVDRDEGDNWKGPEE